MLFALRSHISDHWHGRASFYTLVRLNILGTGFLIYLFARLSTPLPLAAVIVAIIVGVAIQLWQTVGTLRSLNRWLARADGLFLALAAIGALLAVHLVNATQMVTAVSSHLLDPALGKYVAPEQRAILSKDGKTLHLQGEISFGLMSQFQTAMTETISDVTLASTGGNIRAARAIAQDISDNGLNTRAIGPCFSACTLIFMAGRSRSLDKDGTLGFHSYLYAHQINAGGVDVTDEQEKDKAFLISRGVSESFVTRAYATPHSDIWQPQRSELLAAGVITQ